MTRKVLWIAAPFNGNVGVFIVDLGLTVKSRPQFNAPHVRKPRNEDETP